MGERFSGSRFLLAASLLLGATDARAISILDIGDSGTTTDGTIFEANPNPSDPSTGTGVFEPFVRIQGHGDQDEFQNGFNTDEGEPDINFDTKTGIWTHSITFSDVGIVTRNGTQYLEFALDANEPGSVGSLDNEIDLTEVQLFVGPNLASPEPLGSSFLAGGVLDLGSDADLIWRLDNATNLDVTVTLAASICSTPGQCGSGRGDMSMLIPLDALDLPTGFDPSWNLVFYTEYLRAGGATGGFEEWRHREADGVIPEPSAALIFAAGLLAVRRARR